MNKLLFEIVPIVLSCVGVSIALDVIGKTIVAVIDSKNMKAIHHKNIETLKKIEETEIPLDLLYKLLEKGLLYEHLEIEANDHLRLIEGLVEMYRRDDNSIKKYEELEEEMKLLVGQLTQEEITDLMIYLEERNEVINR